MKLTWYGHAAFGLENEQGLKLITDPYTPDLLGYPPIQEEARLVLMSSDDDQAHCRGDLIPGSPEIVNTLKIAESSGTGRYQGLDIQALEAMEWEFHPEHDVPGRNAMYRFEMDGVKVAHMGDVGNALTDSQIEFFKDVDLLFALAGGYLTIELPDLMRMIHKMEPKLIIPMHFRTLTYKPRNTMWIESFLSHFKDEQIDFACESRIKLSKEDIPDKTRVLVMDYVR